MGESLAMGYRGSLNLWALSVLEAALAGTSMGSSTSLVVLISKSGQTAAAHTPLHVRAHAGPPALPTGWGGGSWGESSAVRGQRDADAAGVAMVYACREGAPEAA